MKEKNANKMSEEEKAKRISVTLKPEVISVLDELADDWGTSRSGMISILVKLGKNDKEEYYSRQVEEMEMAERLTKEFGLKKKRKYSKA